MIKAAVLTMSDKGYQGERIDLTGPVIKEMLQEKGYVVEYYKVIPDEISMIEEELVYICDELKIPLVITNGGTGFSKRDVTPEATMKVLDKYVPGIGEVMRNMSFNITPKAMLSRGISGIRKNSLIVNLPGSPKAAKESLGFVVDTLKHGIEIMLGEANECAR